MMHHNHIQIHDTSTIYILMSMVFLTYVNESIDIHWINSLTIVLTTMRYGLV